MLDIIGSALSQVLQPATLLIMLLGIAIGFVVGILPGLGGAVTLALMLPFTFGMEPVQGFAFLLGMWVVTSTAGDLTSVLFGIPGEATSAAAVLDGYPLTRRGEAGRALGAVLTSSAMGAIAGAIVLALTITLIRPVVLALGPPEFFALTIVGLTFVITLSGKSMLKGFIMMTLGLLIALVGIDPQVGIPRFAFGQLYLWDGIDLIPVVVGLFGGAEVLQIMLSKSSIASTGGKAPSKITGTTEGMMDAFRHWWVVLRAAAIGVVVGMLPGLGGSVAQWVSYGQAQQSSKHPEMFGKGAIDGLVAAGATNNAKDAGSLIPTIAFGIPGGAATAVLLGGFMILGLNPGQEMLTTHLDVTFSMVWITIISNLIAVALAVIFIKPLTKLTRIQGPVLIPSLILLLIVGAYTANSRFEDIIVMLVASVIGVACLRWDWPRVPLLLAVVLGGFAETYLNLSTSIFGAEWLTRPGVLVLGAVVVASLTYGVIISRRSKKQPTPQQLLETK
ncbi:MAG: Tripartite tricarboxylate transporter TctA family protein [Homoserinimonas sp.]|nr:Tripartite tricarboxylate transporter TctA family protein [Homoserinimonas sp.]